MEANLRTPAIKPGTKHLILTKACGFEPLSYRRYNATFAPSQSLPASNNCRRARSNPLILRSFIVKSVYCWSEASRNLDNLGPRPSVRCLK
jgi:hypothetical protein